MPPNTTMIIGPNVASSRVPTMISTPFSPSDRPARLECGIGPVPARTFQQRLVGRERFALLAILTRTPPTSLLCGMSCDWILSGGNRRGRSQRQFVL
jgi:hypothetical protein